MSLQGEGKLEKNPVTIRLTIVVLLYQLPLTITLYQEAKIPL